MGFATEVVEFFRSYLVECTMQYSWDREDSSPFVVDVGVGQGSALSPILSALYLSPLLWQFAIDAPRALLMSYVDNGTIIVQSRTWDDNLIKLRRAYGVVF